MKKWFLGLSTVNRVMVLGMSLLFMTTTVLLVYGLLSHTEQGLLTACATPSHTLDYHGDCSAVEWEKSQFPLGVYISSTNSAPPRDPESARSSALSLINRDLGFRALAPVGEQSEAVILIDFEAARDVSIHLSNAHGGALHHRAADGSLWCEIRTWNNGTAELVDKALVHELGHCLGLAHDNFPSSAMYPVISPSSTFGPSRLRFTSYDRALLVRLYH